MDALRCLDEAELAALRAIGTRRRYHPEEPLFCEGDQSDDVVVIERGKVKVSSMSADGYEAVLAVRSSGEIVGEFAALDGLPRSATVLALDEVDGIVVTGDRFRGYLRTHPDAALALLSRVVGRLRDADRRRAEFGAYDVPVRIARLLLDLASQYGAPAAPGPGTFNAVLLLSQAELAGATGASREAVAKVLRQLRDDGAIATRRRQVIILRPEALWELAGYRSAGPSHEERRHGQP
jgi:CRP-like cAMP-binding protein